MRYALTAAQMRSLEDAAIATGTVTIAALMERAGAALASEVARRAPQGPVVVVCGPGNNGGDGWVAARSLAAARRDVCVVTLRRPDELDGDAHRAAARAVADGVVWYEADRLPEMLAGASVIVDAIFGFGFHGPARGAYAQAIDAISRAEASVIAADIPSGVDSDTGAVIGLAVRADVTVSFTALKRGLLLYPGAAYAGEAVIADIGVPVTQPEGRTIEVPDASDLKPRFPWPAAEDHKGSRSRVAVVAGSAAYSGAAILAVSGALRLGPGYVSAVVPEPMAGALRVALPGAIVRAMPAARDGSFASTAEVLASVADADAVVVGPGITTSAGAVGVARQIVSHVTVPVVLDADGLNAFRDDMSGLLARTAPIVCTPHPGEAARLLGIDVAEVNTDRISAVSRLAGQGRTCLLKGAHTLVADEHRLAMVLAGGPGLARAGTGDVLAGMIGTLLAQGVPPFDAAVLGAHLHGRAAEHGAVRLTETCFGATDVMTYLPDAVRELAGG